MSNYIHLSNAKIIQQYRTIEDMHFIKNMDIIEQACNQFVEPHPCYYNLPLEITPLLKHYPHLTLQSTEVELSTGCTQTPQKHSTRLNLIRNKWNSQNCLVYLHGLSSYCLEGRFLIPLLADNLNLCLFDARAHGKNKQKLVTYGLLQSQELFDIVRFLVQRGFKNIVLWGRSMGAVTCLRLLQRLKGSPMIQHIKYVVADAPFCSFKTIATEIVSKKAHMPEFISGVFADAFVEKIRQKHGIDLNLLDLQQLRTVVPVHFLYSSSDELMSQKHIESITKNNYGNFEVNDIKVLHNEERPSWIVAKIITKIRQKLNKNKRFIPCFNNSKKRGLSITKFCDQQILFPKTPTFSSSQIRQDFSSKLNHKFITKRQVMSELYGQHKQNDQSYRKKTARSSKVQLGGSTIRLTSKRQLPSKKDRKITVSQFFIQH